MQSAVEPSSVEDDLLSKQLQLEARKATVTRYTVFPSVSGAVVTNTWTAPPLCPSAARLHFLLYSVVMASVRWLCIPGSPQHGSGCDARRTSVGWVCLINKRKPHPCTPAQEGRAERGRADGRRAGCSPHREPLPAQRAESVLPSLHPILSGPQLRGHVRCDSDLPQQQRPVSS